MPHIMDFTEDVVCQYSAT